MKSLLVFDSSTFFRNLNSIKENIAIVCLGMELEEVKTALGSVGKSKVEVMNIADYSDSAQDSVRHYIIENITQLPSFVEIQTLTDPSYQLNLWYFLKISEKSPLRGELHQRLFYLAQIAYLLESHSFASITFIVRDKLLIRCLENKKTKNRAFKPTEFIFFLNAARYAVQSLGIKAVRNVFRHRISFDAPSTLIFSLFPFWWLNPLTSQSRDRFFPLSYSSSVNLSLGNISWISISLSKYLHQRKQIKGQFGIEKFKVLQDYIQMWHIRSLFSLKRFLLLSRFRHKIQDALLPKFHGHEVGSLISHEISKSIQSADLQLCILVYLTLREYLQQHGTSRIVSRFESQPIDRALIWASEGLTQFVGYWHSTMSMCENYTSLQYPNGYLLDMTQDDLVMVGFPRRMLIPNLYCRETLNEIGYDLSLTAACGPTRHFDVIETASNLKLRGTLKIKNQIAIALSSDPNSCNILADAMVLIKRVNPNVLFAIKTHPAFKTSDEYFKKLKGKIGENSLRVIESSESYIEIISECEVIILSGTQLAFEGILVDTFPIVYEPKGQYCATNFKAFEDSCFIANTVEELIFSLTSILENSPIAKQKKKSWNSLIQKQFGSSNSNSWKNLESTLKKL